MKYDFAAIEAKWQKHWAEHKTFRTPNPGDDAFDPDKPKFYVLDMFPYPSGVGLHVGHPLGYIATDIVARYKRMRGFNVLHPMGFDAFGLPAEQFAVEHGVHPRVTTEKNVATMVGQLKRLGLSYDWDRSLSTTDVDYYKWTQWIFLQLYHSWFDPAENAARPIDELVNMLKNEQAYVHPDGDVVYPPAEGLGPIEGDPIGMLKWHELPPEEQRDILDSKRLAYLAEVPVNWCPALGTVLANEEVTNDGRSERGNHPVVKRPLKQWMLRITAYAERLIDDLEQVAWPEPIKLMQRNWIGKSEGAYVDFTVDSPDAQLIRVYTTRPDTLFGATYMVLAPEHPLVDEITTDAQRAAVNSYRAEAAARSDVDRMADAKEKTGVATGAHAINPVNNERIPIWIADYVMMGYGTGAIMAVPAHDDRDFEFAKQFDLPIRPVVAPTHDWLTEQAQAAEGLQSLGTDALRTQYESNPASFPAAFTGATTSINSENDERILTGLPTDEAKAHITVWLEGKDLGKAAVQYKLRDWLFSRQRYWGEPFPILHAPDGSIRAVDVNDLPVELPPMDDFKPHASDDPNAEVQTPLSRASESWKHVTLDGVTYTRELNTMPQWAGSCWYYLRFIDPKNNDRFVSDDAEHYWMVSPKKDGTPHTGGIDLYVGGAEHAVLHLLYARFWHKVLFDLKQVSTPEPFGRLFNQGYIQAYAFTDERGVYVEADQVEERPGAQAKITRMEVNRKTGHNAEKVYKTDYFYKDNPVIREYGKMGKSLKNAVNPDEMCDQFGCDSLRLYEMYLGPLDQSKPWRTEDIVGVHRFLQRLWRNFVDDETGDLLVSNDPPTDPPDDLTRLTHKTIAAVTGLMDAMSFNVAIAKLIELNNALVALPTVPRGVAEPMVLLLAPLAPHMAEELWQRLGHDTSLSAEPWPTFDPALVVDDEIELPVQIMGKVRTRITVPADADDKAVEETALSDDKVKELIDGKTVRKVIVVKGRLVNIVAN